MQLLTTNFKNAKSNKKNVKLSNSKRIVLNNLLNSNRMQKSINNYLKKILNYQTVNEYFKQLYLTQKNAKSNKLQSKKC